MLIIAHRMRTVMGADKVVVLADGRVAEEGTPKALMNKKGMDPGEADSISATSRIIDTVSRTAE